MQYRLDKKSGNKLSALGFGCMRFAEAPKDSGGIKLGIDEKKIEELLLTAIDKGINYFDTAYIYPGSEEFLGKVLNKHKLREKVYIATKFPLVMARKQEDLDKFFDAQLKRLKTDNIDYYLIHMLSDMDTWNKLCSWGIKEWIQDKKKSGAIKQIGFSFHGSRDSFLALLDAYDWDFAQIQYNYSDENYQAGITGLKAAAAKGISVMIMEPLLGGRLVNGLPEKALERFRRVEPSTSPAEWGLRWVWNHPEVTVVLSGMNEMKQLEDNLEAVEKALPESLSEEQKKAYQDVTEIFNESYKVHCTGCHYCMPCPYGVNIPGCFSAYNAYFAINKKTGKNQYNMTNLYSAEHTYASLCKKCGACEKKCPQHLPIREHLSDVSKTMEGIDFKIMKTVGNLVFKKKSKKI